MGSKGYSLPLIVNVQTGTATLDISMAVSQKIQNNLPQDPPVAILGIYSKGVQSYHKDMFNYVHSSIICNSQNLARKQPRKLPRYPSTKG